MKSILIVLLLGAAAAQLPDAFARFSYSSELARRLNAREGAGADMPRFVIDDAQGRELADRRLIGAIQSLIRAFPGCGNRQLQFAYAYGEAPDALVVAFSQTVKRAPECPAIATVSLSKSSTAVTVRSFPDI